MKKENGFGPSPIVIHDRVEAMGDREDRAAGEGASDRPLGKAAI